MERTSCTFHGVHMCAPIELLPSEWRLCDNIIRNWCAGGQKSAKSVTDVDTWKRLLQGGGCGNADDVVRAFRRIVEAGAKGRSIPATDILIVRSCGRTLVENLRQKALRVRAPPLAPPFKKSL